MYVQYTHSDVPSIFDVVAYVQSSISISIQHANFPGKLRKPIFVSRGWYQSENREQIFAQLTTCVAIEK